MTDQTKHPGGRPSTYSDDITDAICTKIAGGMSLLEICEDPAMPGESTVYRWLGDETKPEFREKYARAREIQADRFGDEILEISDDARNDWMLRKQGEDTVEVLNHEHISRSKLRVDSRKWLMSKLAPKKYGDRVDSTVRHEASDPLTAVLSAIADRGKKIHDKD